MDKCISYVDNPKTIVKIQHLLYYYIVCGRVSARITFRSYIMDEIVKKWEQILEFIRDEYDITNVAFNTFLKPLTVSSVDKDTIYILVPTDQIGIDYIKKKYYLPIKVTVAEVLDKEYEIEFLLPDEAAKKNTLNLNNMKRETQPLDQSNLNPNYTFDTFVVGNNSRMAHAAAIAVAESPGKIYNPLFLYGGVGLGKTHLMHSIGHHILEQDPSSNILYVTSEEFTNEVIESVRSGNAASMTKLRDKYRNVDVLMIDDIQFIIGKETTQEEFFHTFNALQHKNKAIIITSDKPPKEMETLEERFRSRFEMGLMADISTPDYETRMAILRKKAENDNFMIDNEILNYIATNIKSNIRELEGALNKLIFLYNMEHQEITMEIAVKELQSIINPDEKKAITPKLIIDVVCDHFGITRDQLISKDRRNEVAKPRQIVMYLCKNMTQSTYNSIGDALGGKDHATVIHGIRTITDQYDNNEKMRNTIDTIKKKINPN